MVLCDGVVSTWCLVPTHLVSPLPLVGLGMRKIWEKSGTFFFVFHGQSLLKDYKKDRCSHTSATQFPCHPRAVVPALSDLVATISGTHPKIM